MKWIINTTKVLIVASATSWVAQNLNTETNYDTLAAAIGLEGNSFKTYIIVSATLGGVVVVAMTPLMTLLFGSTLDTSSSQAALIITGITIIATTPSYKLLTIPSVILGSLLIVLGICLKVSQLAQELNAPQDYCQKY